MNSKTRKIIAILMMMVFACSMMLVGCGKKEAPAPEKTLETLAQEDASIQEALDNAFAQQGLDGTCTIEGNTVKMVVKIDSLLGDGIELDDATKQLFQDSFDKSFNDVEADLQKSITDIEKSAGITGVSIDVIITYADEEVYTRTFTSGA